MRFVNIATIFALVASAQAFVIPDGTVDGVYAVESRSDGTEVHTKLADAVKRGPTPGVSEVKASPLEARQSFTMYCGCGFNMNVQNTNDAVADIKNQLGANPSNNIKPRMSIYSIRGSVVAFVCSKGDYHQTVSGEFFAQSAALISSACGNFIAGTRRYAHAVGFPNEGTMCDIGYMRYSSGLDFCANAATSPRSSC